ncbi:MAG: hypothetical protein GF387_02880 [Candidatus Portnoybacteria bacterium]|nr:hypothetical protein [Candidatus Portnoybacteria bacterium]
MEKIKKRIEEIFSSMGIKPKEINTKKDNSSKKDQELIDVDISLNQEDAEWFLNESAMGMRALQHLVRLVLFKDIKNRPFLVLDINKHKQKAKRVLEEKALEVAQKVRREKKALSLEPMSAYERRLIHMKLAEQPDIITESSGEEPNRKIIIRPYP